MRLVQKQQNEKDDSLTVPATTVYTVFGVGTWETSSEITFLDFSLNSLISSHFLLLL